MIIVEAYNIICDITDYLIVDDLDDINTDKYIIVDYWEKE